MNIDMKMDVIMPMPTMLTNPCNSTRQFDFMSQNTILVSPPGVTYTCLLNQHELFNAPGDTQMDDVIGIVTASTFRASAFTFFHSLLWQTSKPIMQDDMLNLWVTYKGWDAVNNT